MKKLRHYHKIRLHDKVSGYFRFAVRIPSELPSGCAGICKNNTYFAKISIYDEYAGVYNHVQAKVNGEANHIDFIFNSYLEDEENSNKPFNIGDKLLSFSKTETGIRTHWDKIAPVKDINKIDGTYFKIRENSDGFVGPWYTSLPYTRGNSTTINIKEMTNTSVSFHLYFCRTYT